MAERETNSRLLRQVLLTYDKFYRVTLQIFLNYSANHFKLQYNEPTAKLVEQASRINNSSTSLTATWAQQQAAVQIRLPSRLRPNWAIVAFSLAFVAAPFVPAVERDAMDLQDTASEKCC